jgi:hypothetical protein
MVFSPGYLDIADSATALPLTFSRGANAPARALLRAPVWVELRHRNSPKIGSLAELRETYIGCARSRGNGECSSIVLRS